MRVAWPWMPEPPPPKPRPAAAGRHHRVRDPVRARDRDVLAGGVDRRMRVEMRVPAPQLARVVRHRDGSDLREPERAEGVDHAGKDVLSFPVDDLGVRRDVHIASDRDDAAVPEHDRPALDDAVGHRVDRGPLHGERSAVLCGGVSRQGNSHGPDDGRRRDSRLQHGADPVVGSVAEGIPGSARHRTPPGRRPGSRSSSESSSSASPSISLSSAFSASIPARIAMSASTSNITSPSIYVVRTLA